MRGRWKVVPHTAEVALGLSGPDWPSFYEAAAAGVLAIYAAEPAPRGEESRRVSLGAGTPEDLLVAWLNELIYLVGAKRWVPLRAQVKEADATRLVADLEGSSMPEGVHVVQEIKAATFGGLSIRASRKGGHTATVILDV